MMNIRRVQVSLDKMKKFAIEMDKTQYDYDYVIISSIFIQKRNIWITIEKFEQQLFHTISIGIKYLMRRFN